MSKIIDKETVLEIFYIHPNQWYHVRELSRLLKISPTTISNYLHSFAQEGLLEQKAERRHLLFKANTENTPFKTKKIQHNLEKIQKSGLLEFLEGELNFPKVIILFGSYAKGENAPGSDIDLFILTETEKEPNLNAFTKKLGAEIQLFLYSTTKFKTMKKKNPELFNTIVNGIKLSGFIDVA